MKIKKDMKLNWKMWKATAMRDSFKHEGIELVAIHVPQLESCYYCVPVDSLKPIPHKETWCNVYISIGVGALYANKEQCDFRRKKNARRSHYLRNWQDMPDSEWQHERIELDGEDE